MSAEASLRLDDEWPDHYSLDVVLDQDDEILTNVENEMTSSIRFEIRIYKMGAPLLGVLGRNLVFSKNIEYEGWWDPFFEAYVLSGDGEEAYYEDPVPFLADFFSIRKIPIPLKLDEGKFYEIRVKAVLSKIKLLPPFNIMTPFRLLSPGTITRVFYEFEKPKSDRT